MLKIKKIDFNPSEWGLTKGSVEKTELVAPNGAVIARRVVCDGCADEGPVQTDDFEVVGMDGRSLESSVHDWRFKAAEKTLQDFLQRERSADTERCLTAYLVALTRATR